MWRIEHAKRKMEKVMDKAFHYTYSHTVKRVNEYFMLFKLLHTQTRMVRTKDKDNRIITFNATLKGHEELLYQTADNKHVYLINADTGKKVKIYIKHRIIIID